jgi:hypothetical protein
MASMKGLSKRRIIVAAGALLGTIPLMGASCATLQGYTNSGAPKIQFEGDSITVGETDDINARYGATFDVSIEANVGATAYEKMPGIVTDATHHPQVAVIDLGTNDSLIAITGRTRTVNGVTSPWDPVEPITNVEARLDTIAGEFAPGCVVFVTINTQDPSFYGTNVTQGIANAQALNDHIRSMPGIQVADWDANLTPADFDPSDQTHPNEVGNQAMLALINQAIGRCPPPATSSTTASG